MRSLSPASSVLCAAAAGLMLAAALPARAQEDDQPRRAPPTDVGVKPRNATSGIEATRPALTPAEQRQAHALSMAIFARPSAAAKAAAKVDAANQPDLAPPRAKGDWSDDKGGVGMGGKGVEFKAPF